MVEPTGVAGVTRNTIPAFKYALKTIRQVITLHLIVSNVYLWPIVLFITETAWWIPLMIYIMSSSILLVYLIRACEASEVEMAYYETITAEKSVSSPTYAELLSMITAFHNNRDMKN